jgi:hypothetical protein
MCSEAFTAVLACLIREPIAEKSGEVGLAKTEGPASQSIQQMEAARLLHRQGYPETLCVLCDHWQNIAVDDPQT